MVMECGNDEERQSYDEVVTDLLDRLNRRQRNYLRTRLHAGCRHPTCCMCLTTALDAQIDFSSYYVSVWSQCATILDRNKGLAHYPVVFIHIVIIVDIFTVVNDRVVQLCTYSYNLVVTFKLNPIVDHKIPNRATSTPNACSPKLYTWTKSN